MISRVSLIALIVAVLVGSSIAVDSLRHNRIELEARETPQQIGTRFFEQEVKPRVDTELADNDDFIRRHYVVERQYYNVWVTQTVFVLLSRHFGIDLKSLRDQDTAGKVLTDEQAEAIAWAMYETRHYLRVKIRQREELRGCMKLVVAILRARDKHEYGSPDGPTWDWLLSRKLKKFKVDQQTGKALDKRISLEIIFSAAAPNGIVNGFIEWVASKTGGTMTDTELQNLMKNSDISKTELETILGQTKGLSCVRTKKDDTSLPNENLLLEFILTNPTKQEFPEESVPLLVLVPSSDNLSPPQSPKNTKKTGLQ